MKTKQEEFFKRSSNKDGYDNKCKKCVKDKVPVSKEIFEQGYKKCKVCEQIKQLQQIKTNHE